jgi:hypothetical protein
VEDWRTIVAERILGDSPEQRIRRLWHDTPDGGAVIETKQDVSDVVAINKRDYNDSDGKFNDFQTMVASIPSGVFFDLQKQGIVDDEKRFKAWLNDPDNRFFRTHPGKL